MDPSSGASIVRLIARAETDPEVLAVILFGSRARGAQGYLEAVARG